MQEEILPSLPVPLPGEVGYFNYPTVFWSTVVVGIVAVLGWLLGRRLRKYPGRRQMAAEFLVGWFDTLCRDVLGPGRGRRYLAIFGSLFLFVVLCNTIGVLPLRALSMGLFPEGGIEIGGEPYVDFNDSGAWDPGEPAADAEGRPVWDRMHPRLGGLVPSLEEPTKNVGVALGLSLLLAAGMYGAALLIGGIRGVGKALFEPIWFMFPLNAVGMVAQVVSVSFRLFGNIFGGAVIMVVVPRIIWKLVPTGADALANTVAYWAMVGFLGLFVGVIQAFVFTMLWITYHADLIAEESEEA